MNLCLLLDMACDAFGDRPIAGARGSSLTANDVRRHSIAGARRLRQANASALIYLDVNSPCLLVALFAAARAGVPLVPINYRLDDERLGILLAKHPGATAVCGDGHRSLVAAAGISSIYSTHEWLSRASELTDDHDLTPIDSAAPAVVLYTSGTTAEPKGVLLRHDNVVNYVVSTVELGSADERDAALVSVPPYHIAGIANAITNLYAGRRCVVLANFVAPVWLDLVRVEGITNALVVPTMLTRILDSVGNADVSVPSLRTLAYGGASMPHRTIERALETWPNVDFVNAYGLTETSSTIAVLGPDDHRAALASSDPDVRARLGSVGRPLPTVDVQIRDRDGLLVPPGIRGRIWVRGAQVSGEYAGLGSVLDSDGFFDTRDEGQLDAEGYLFVGGRADDTIIRGGENIAPAQIEAILLARPDVQDALVVGVPDPEWGERIEAVIVPAAGSSPDPESVRADVRGALRSSLTPERIWVWTELPRTETGKPIRRDVVRMLAG